MSLREVKLRFDIGPVHAAIKGGEAKLGQPGYIVGENAGPEAAGTYDIVVIADAPDRASVWESGDEGQAKIRDVVGKSINTDPTTRKKLHFS